MHMVWNLRVLHRYKEEEYNKIPAQQEKYQ